MRFHWVGLALALVACDSSVDLCGGTQVCGTDGVTYTDTCALEVAGATLDHIGRCRDGECTPCDGVECFGEQVFDANGCWTCECICGPGDCPEGLDCVAGTCIPTDGGVMPTDGAVLDGSRPDSGECSVDIDCGPGRCVGEMCVFECDIADDCDDDGLCETLLGTELDCLNCGDDCFARGGPRTDPICVPEVGCEYPCAEGFARCDMGVGCDINLARDRENCGDCGILCTDNQICDDGCVDCLDGEARCGNECTDLDSDPNHCGRCGVTCEGMEDCISGVCIDPRCLDADSPLWSCSEVPPGICQCQCGRIQVGISDGVVMCPIGFSGPGSGCSVETMECGAYDPREIAACCVD